MTASASPETSAEPPATTMAPIQSAPAPIVSNATNPTAVGNVSDPCGRLPDTEGENDHIGASAALDEMGYKIVAAQDSPINMKRFICRVVAKLDCQVTDYASLMDYSPNHAGLANRANYQHLEDELSLLCYSAETSWLSPA